MPDNPAGRFLTEMTRGPGKISFRVSARTACDCGCGLPRRVEFSAGGHELSVDDPVAIDALIDTLVESREKLWGPRPMPKDGAK